LPVPACSFRSLAPAAGGLEKLRAAADPSLALERGLFDRPEPYEARRAKQVVTRAFPTTTIGSFPQTADVRRARWAGACCGPACLGMPACAVAAVHMSTAIGMAWCGWSFENCPAITPKGSCNHNLYNTCSTPSTATIQSTTFHQSLH
jgi:hypothetical protein